MADIAACTVVRDAAVRSERDFTSAAVTGVAVCVNNRPFS